MTTKDQAPKKQPYWLVTLFLELGNHVLSIVFILLIYLLLWLVPQINDLIAVMPQVEHHWWAMIVLFTALTVFAFLVSHAHAFFHPPEEGIVRADTPNKNNTHRPHMFTVPKDAKEKAALNNELGTFSETQEEYIQRVLPRILGTLLLLIATFAVNNTYEIIYGTPIFILQNWGLLVAILLMVLFLNKKVADYTSRLYHSLPWSNYYAPVLAALCMGLIIILGWTNSGGDSSDVKKLFYSLLALSVFFLLVSSSYNSWIIKFKMKIGGRVVWFLTLVSLILYLALCYEPSYFQGLSPLPIVMVCLLGMFFLANLIKLLGFRLNFGPLLFYVVFGALAISILTANLAQSTHYEVPDVEFDSKTYGVDKRLPLQDYVKHWVRDRREDLLQQKKGQKFPIILVSSEGGGSRAALWSALVQGYLYEQNPDYFRKYLFSITGASGGGVGNNMFYAHANHLQRSGGGPSFKHDPNKDSLGYRASSVFKADFLSTSIAAIMGRDLFKNITTLGDFKDRGKKLEEEWEQAFAAHFGYSAAQNPLAKAYLEMMPDTNDRYIKPLLITNTTHLQSGQRALISPVDMALDAHNLNVFMDLLGCYPKEGRSIKQSTAMSLNARFPYLSPVGQIADLGQFGDAGYYNNLGGDVTRRLQVALERELEKDSLLSGTYEIKNLLITNYEAPWCSEGTTMSSQILAPALLVWNATFAHPIEMERTLKGVVNVQSRRTRIPPENISPVIPLGRYLSTTAARSMEERLKKEQWKLDGLMPN